MRDYIYKSVFIVVSVSCVFWGLGCIGPPSTAYYQPPPSAPALSSQERAEMTEERINALVDRGDEEYARENFFAAKDYYYRAMLAQSDPDPYVLASYAATLTRLEAFDNALEVFKMALAKDPDNEMIRKSIALCEGLIEEEAMGRQMFEVQRRIDQIQNLINLATSVRDLNRQVRRTVNAHNGGGVQRPAQYYSESGGGSDGGGSSGDCSMYKQRYENFKSKRDSEASSATDRHVSNVKKDATGDGSSPYSTGGATSGDRRLENQAKSNARSYQREMDRVAGEARRAGCPGF